MRITLVYSQCRPNFLIPEASLALHKPPGVEGILTGERRMEPQSGPCQDIRGFSTHGPDNFLPPRSPRRVAGCAFVSTSTPSAN